MSAIKFKYEEIAAWCDGFAQDRELGAGGFGRVYRGSYQLTAVAVKLLDRTGLQTEQEFAREIEILSQFRHPNLVILLGYGIGPGDSRALVYELCDNGSVEDFLKNHPALFDWRNRMRVGDEAAIGLSYLHSFQEPVIHHDFKPANLLLDQTFRVKIGDFGLSKLLNTTTASSALGGIQIGTPGYICNDYAATGRTSDKVDVYAFGVFLMQLATEEEAYDARNRKTLAELVTQKTEDGTMQELLSPHVRSWDKGCLSEFIALAIRCTHATPSQRPSMMEVGTKLGEMLKKFPPTPIDISQTQMNTIRIATLSDEVFEVSVPAYATIGDIKAAIFAVNSLEPGFQKLVLRGKTLNDDSQKLTATHWKEGDKLHLLYQLPDFSSQSSSSSSAAAAATAAAASTRPGDHGVNNFASASPRSSTEEGNASASSRLSSSSSSSLSGRMGAGDANSQNRRHMYEFFIGMQVMKILDLGDNSGQDTNGATSTSSASASSSSVSATSPAPASTQRPVDYGTVVSKVNESGQVAVLWQTTGNRSMCRCGGANGVYDIVPVYPTVGKLVQRGTHWKWNNQDGGEGGVGVIVDAPQDPPDSENPWVQVQWRVNSVRNTYRWGKDGAYDLRLVDPAHFPADVPPVVRGMQVQPGPDWVADQANGNNEGCGTVVEVTANGWLGVSWNAGNRSASPETARRYRYGAEGKHEVRTVEPEAGMAVARGIDWSWGDQDGGVGKIGTITRTDVGDPGWVEVRWDNTTANNYRWGKDGKYELKVVVRPEAESSVVKLKEGTPVTRGVDWKWEDQDGGPNSYGIVTSPVENGWATVEWDKGGNNKYRWGRDGKYDLKIVTPVLKMKVMRGKHWKWGDQDGGDGGVGEVSKVDVGDVGWVEITWSDGRKNNYRWGKEDCFDLRVVDPSTPSFGRRLRAGMQVRRGPDWKWEDQDGGVGNFGTVTTSSEVDGWVHIEWAMASANKYRWGKDGRYDVEIVEPEVGQTVIRGKHWKWEDQDGGRGKTGVITKVDVGDKGWVEVRWSNGSANNYRWGASGKFDLALIRPRDATGQSVSAGVTVVRGRDWKWDDQDGGEGKRGVITAVEGNGWVRVRWSETGTTNTYRWGNLGKFDVQVVEGVPSDWPIPGMQVQRGPDWKWDDQDGGAGNYGTVSSPVDEGWVMVEWARASANKYRWGEGYYDLKIVKPVPNMKVSRGKQWEYGNDDGGVGSVGVITGMNVAAEPGVVEVRWSNGNVGRYRWGKDNCFDLCVADVAETLVPGMQVVRGPHWKWGEQDDGVFGTVKSDVENGWVTIQWCRAGSNKYRWGHDGCYDLRIVQPQKGMAVSRGADWKWESQDGGAGGIGIIQSAPEGGWVKVQWRSGGTNSYRMGADGKFDLKIVGAASGT